MIETGPDGVAAHLDIPVDVQGFAPPEEFASFLKSVEEDSKEASVNNAETTKTIFLYWNAVASPLRLR